MSAIESLGASVAAVSPQTPEASLATARENQVTFNMLSDRGNAIARKFGLVFELPEDVRRMYKSFGHDLVEAAGDESYELPIPATYVIDRESVIRMAFVDADHMYRVDPEAILESLREIARSG